MMKNPFSEFPDWLPADHWKLYESARSDTLETIREYIRREVAKLAKDGAPDQSATDALLNLHEYIFNWRPGTSTCTCLDCDRLATTIFAACKPCTDAGCDIGEGQHPE